MTPRALARSLGAQHTDRELFSLRRHNEKLPSIQTHTHSQLCELLYIYEENTHISLAFVIYKKYLYINHDKSVRRGALALSRCCSFLLEYFFSALVLYRYVARRHQECARDVYIWFKKLHAWQNYSTLLCVTLADCCYHH